MRARARGGANTFKRKRRKQPKIPSLQKPNEKCPGGKGEQ